MRNLVSKDELNILTSDIIYMKKDFGRLCTRDEFLGRFNAFNSDINNKLNERPTASYFKKILAAYDDKIS